MKRAKPGTAYAIFSDDQLVSESFLLQIRLCFVHVFGVFKIAAVTRDLLKV